VPNFRALGPRLGPKVPAVKAALASADGAEVSRSLEETGSYTVMVDGEPVVLAASELEVRAEEHEEFALTQDGPYAVALDLAVDDELRLEGLARELARAVNDHRKATGLEIADRIRVRLWGNGLVAEAAERHGQWIAGEVLAVDWQVNPDDSPSGETLDVEGTPVVVSLEVV
jgi:isoleucyl-tRNA synthetase